MRTLFRTLSALTFVLAFASPVAAQDHAHPAGDPSKLGDVSFATSCAAGVADDFEVAVAMLHSFWFEPAADAFRGVAAADPSCGMAHWGVAMTLMGNPMTRALPSTERIALGRAAAAQAKELAAKASHREQMYADAVVAYYAGDGASFAQRMTAHEQALAALHRMHGAEDPEATIFYGRALVANAPPTDLTFAKQLAAAELMQPLFERAPRHPGLAHYLIHAYDVPKLATRGEAAAFAYAGIAPDAPHALHMPSHIFTRLGYWDESIDTNARSAQAEPVPDAAVHPLDYMVYAYLQQGRDADAQAVVKRAVDKSNSDAFYGGLLGYNFAAMNARYLLERGRWADAMALEVPTNALPFVEAVPRFARALGAARSGSRDALEVAAAEAEALGRLHARLTEAGDAYWATIVKAQRIAAEAWIAKARGNAESAVLLAREAAELEETVEKHPVTPGPLLPARELEADLLFELRRYGDALATYEKTLEREPRRARTLYGAARAAEAAGQVAVARKYYGALLEVMAKADAGRPEVEAARRVTGS